MYVFPYVFIYLFPYSVRYVCMWLFRLFVRSLVPSCSYVICLGRSFVL